MGGGDLNLKKSWHPQTMKNQERVWKAEQAKHQEDKKLKELQKEISHERDREELRRIGQSSGTLRKGSNNIDNKLEWMYKNNAELINREEYLLGRTVDKSFEQLHKEEQRQEHETVGMKQSINHVEHECIPFSIRSYKQVESKEQVDLQRKILEDPLMLIKQREMDSRRKLLENPVKLKELHRMLKIDQTLKLSHKSNGKKSKKSKKSKKNKSKKKHTRHTDDSSFSSSDSSDLDLDKKIKKYYKNLQKSEHGQHLEMLNLNSTKMLDAKFETLSKQLDKTIRESNKARRNDSYSEDETDRVNKRKKYRKFNRSRSPRHRNDRDSHRRSRSLSVGDRSKRDYRKSRSQARKPSYDLKTRMSKLLPADKKQITEEEKEARRQEMMQNAVWREADRTKNVQKQREAYAQEEAQWRNSEFDKDFLNKQIKKAIGKQDSVGSRLRANLNNIQRASHAMDSNFAKK